MVPTAVSAASIIKGAKSQKMVAARHAALSDAICIIADLEGIIAVILEACSLF